jgi:hypothetical protein
MPSRWSGHRSHGQRRCHRRVAGTPRAAPCGATEARARLGAAEAYLETAELVLGEASRREFANIAAGLAVLAGIAASDGICCARLGLRHRGDDHRGATGLLEQATPDGKKLATALRRLLDVKDAAHYGVSLVNARIAANATRSAKSLVERARDEVER